MVVSDKAGSSKGAKNSKKTASAAKGSFKGTSNKGISKKTVGAGGRTATDVPRQTAASRAGLTFSVSRIRRFLKKGRYAKQISPLFLVGLTATIEFLVAELCTVASDKAKARKRRRIMPRDIMLGIADDEEFKGLLRDVTIPDSGRVAHVHHTLSKKKIPAKMREEADSGEGRVGKESQSY